MRKTVAMLLALCLTLGVMAALSQGRAVEADDEHKDCPNRRACGYCYHPEDEKAVTVTPEYRKVSAQEAKRMMDEQPEALIVDVRLPEEYAQGHIPGALLLPLPDIGSEQPALLPDKHATVLVYCRSGVRSRDAASRLVAMGYTAVYDMGGISSWPYEVVSD